MNENRITHNQKREHWGSQIGFILAAAGSAIGLGTLWMFPYVTGTQGGGGFVFLYILFTFLIGIPIFIAETMLGRKAQRSPVGVFRSLKTHTLWSLSGWLGVASSFFILCYYIVVAGWGLNYAFVSLCTQWSHKTPQEISSGFNALYHCGDITLFWQFCFLGITGSVVYQGIKKGIEKWSKGMTIALFIILSLFFIYGTTLQGFKEAFLFVLKPNYETLTAHSALEALGLSFFTLSLGQGVMFTYGSYSKDNTNLSKIGCIIGVADVGVSLLAALTIFPILFTFNQAPNAGPGLVFTTIPLVFSQLPGSLILGVAFFILLTFTALTSSLALCEVVVAHLMDIYQLNRKKATAITLIIVGLLSIPCGLSNTHSLFGNWQNLYGKTFFETLSSLVSNWLLPLGGLLTSLYVGWSAPKKMIQEEFCKGPSSKFLFHIWFFLIKFMAPFSILLLIGYVTKLININLLISWIMS